MKRYISDNLTNSLLSITRISSIIYVEDFEDLERFDSRSLIATDYVQAAKKSESEPDYTLWNRDQLLDLKRSDLGKFNNIRNDYVLFKILKHEDLTVDQLRYIASRKEVSREVTLAEIKHLLKLIRECKRITVLPSPKNVEFEEYLSTYGIELEQEDIDDIMHNLHIKNFTGGRYSTDERYWGNTLVTFGFEDANYTFACGKQLPANALPFGIYIKVDQNLSTQKTVIVVSFHKAEHKLNYFIDYPVEKEHPETW